MTPIRTGLCAAVLLGGLALLATPAVTRQAGDRPELWVHLFFSVASDDGLARAKEILPRAAAAGVTRALLADSGLCRPDRPPSGYRERLTELKGLCDQLGIDLVPGVAQIGYSGAIMSRNPNLDEGLPVRDTLFVVEGGEARLVADPEPAVQDGGFEEPAGDEFTGWSFQDKPGVGSFADREVKHGGGASLRFTNIGAADPQYGHGRIHQVIPVSPYRYYRVSAWVRTEDLDTKPQSRIYLANMDGAARSFGQLSLETTQDWKRYTVIVNSLEATQLRLYLGTWGGTTGSIWWDDVEVHEVGLVNLLRRAGCPVTVRGEGGADYEEGRDYEPLPGMEQGISTWWEGEWPEEMPLRLTAGSRIADGERLRVSYYHAARVLGDQTMCCLSEPEVYEYLADEARYVEDLLHPRTWFMNHDEIRVANWCQACQSRGLTPGGLLADNVRRSVAAIRAASPQADIWVWSDMFDPSHNAHGDYYMVNGSWEGSWEGLTPDIGIANWYRDGGLDTMRWFAERGHRQILCGYYDDPSLYNGDWLAEGRAANVPNLLGAMYTTWVPQYGDLEAWARDVLDKAP